MTAPLRLQIGDRVLLRGGSECATVFANPYTFKGKRHVAVVWDHRPKHVLTVEVARLGLVERARFHVGDHVTVTGGEWAGARGRLTRRNPSMPLDRVWLVLFDEPFPRAGKRYYQGGCFESELGSWSVHPDHRPVSVGALYHPRRGER